MFPDLQPKKSQPRTRKKRHQTNCQLLPRYPTPLFSSSQIVSLSRVGERRRLDSDTLLAKDIQHELRRTVVLVDLLAVLEQLHVRHVLVEQVGAVHRAALGLGVELSREDGASLVHHTLVASVVEVDKVLLEVGRQAGGLNGVSVVLRGDV